MGAIAAFKDSRVSGKVSASQTDSERFISGCSLEVNHYFKHGGSFWKMINPY